MVFLILKSERRCSTRELPSSVLFCSLLDLSVISPALGINLPAHLVIVKSTTQMVAGSDGQEYSSAQILQMIGRAGRPQFDKTATAVIMTKMCLKVHGFLTIICVFKHKMCHNFGFEGQICQHFGQTLPE